MLFFGVFFFSYICWPAAGNDFERFNLFDFREPEYEFMTGYQCRLLSMPT